MIEVTHAAASVCRMAPAWRADAPLCGSRRLRICRRSSAVATCVCASLAAAAVLLALRSAKWGAQLQPADASSLLTVYSTDREALGALLPTSAGPPSHGDATDGAHQTQRRVDVQQQPLWWDQPDWDPSAVNLASCMAERDDETPFSVQDFEAARPARMRVEAVLSSAQRRKLPVTVTVTATPSKLSLLEGQCESWAGPLSVAFYIAVKADGTPPDKQIAAAVAAVTATFEKLEGLGRCQADIVVYSERLTDDAATAALFPINILRNNAILMARTPLILLADADLLVGADLAEAMADSAEYQQALDLCRRKHFVVVPVLETHKVSHAYDCAKGGKRAVLEHMQNGKAWGNKMRHSSFLHGSTNFSRWETADAPFRIRNTHDRFEPWGLMYRPALGFFDVRYRGYGRNKIQHLYMHLTQMGWRYVVHHRGYMMHRPHRGTPAKREFMAGSAIAAQASAAVATGIDPKTALARAAQGAPGSLLVFGSNSGFFEAQKAAGRRYRPLLTPGFQRCRAQLPWWQIYGLEGEPMQAVTWPPAPQQEPEFTAA